jgi:hypothetical protein
MALKTFECKFFALLRAPMDQDGIDNLVRVQQLALKCMSQDANFDDVEALPTVTLEKVKEGCMNLFSLIFIKTESTDVPWT